MLLQIATRLMRGYISLATARSCIEAYADECFPVQWRESKIIDRDEATPLEARRVRKANYAAVQRLWHMMRKNVADCVLDGSWRTAYGRGKGLPEGCGNYRKKVFMMKGYQNTRPVHKRDYNWSLLAAITTNDLEVGILESCGTAPGLDRMDYDQLVKCNGVYTL